MTRRHLNQYVAQMSRFDAVGAEALAIQELLAKMGYASKILCSLADPQLHSSTRQWSRKLAEAAELTLIHHAHGSLYLRQVLESPEPKALIYHNITPPEYFRGTHKNLERASVIGRAQLLQLAECVPFAVAHSRFSARELEEAGFENVRVVPYLGMDRTYQVEPDPVILRRFSQDEWTNLICVGQVAPHKCIEDCLFTFDYFRRFVRPRSRLLIIGGWHGTAAYYERLKRLVKSLDLSGVVFTGQVSQAALNAYFEVAHALLCMSEHEGFCVPLVEAGRFGVPVFAYAAAAVSETLDGSGTLFERKDWPLIAEAIGALLEDRELLSQIVADQRRQLERFSPTAVAETLTVFLNMLSEPIAFRSPPR